jgi:hypothetical protein
MDYTTAQTMKISISHFTLMLRKIGNGATISFWMHNWGMGFLKYEFSILFSFALDHSISVQNVYNMDSLEQLFRLPRSLRSREEF